ncbi:hypothetical protein BGW41_000517 [Actinomortierella wolfii]|nr:hypothetical protein BGW41_000517 [Actinomortierella wolfii]
MTIQENPIVMSVAGQGPEAGTAIRSFVLTDEESCPGMACQVMTLGATLTHLWVPDNQSRKRDIVLGFDDLTAYRSPHDPYFGASVGRVANRIGHGEFSLPDNPSKVYKLDKNNGPHSLHGGIAGFSHKNWQVVNSSEDKPNQKQGGTFITFRVVSEHLDQGFPGKLAVECTYTLKDRALEIVYTAQLLNDDDDREQRKTSSEESSVEETIVSLTNHAYFNLNGIPSSPSPLSTPTSSNTCLEHWLQFQNIDHYLENDSTSLPTGKVVPLDKQPAMDFRVRKRIGHHLSQVPLLEHCRGYDHFFVANTHNHNNSSPKDDDNLPLTVLAKIWSPESGIQMTLSTTEPGFQLYTANWVQLAPGTVDGHPATSGNNNNNSTTAKGKASAGYCPHAGFCLETSRFPDAINHKEWQAQVLLKSGERHYARTRFTFDVVAA